MPLAAVTVVTLSSVVRLDAILGEGDKPAGRSSTSSFPEVRGQHCCKDGLLLGATGASGKGNGGSDP